MVFTTDEFVNGILAIIWVLVSVIVGIKIASRYRKYKENNLLYIGICWAAIAQAWYGTSISFIVGLFNDGVGLSDVPQVYFIIGTPGMAFFHPLWIWVISGLINKEKQKLITSVILIIDFLYIIFFFTFVWSTEIPHPIAELQSPVDIKHNGISMIFMIYVIVSIFASGIVLSRQLIKSDIPENKLKGKFLLICFISFVVGSILDSVVTQTVIALFITRGILILSAITMYCGWLLPSFIKNKFIK